MNTAEATREILWNIDSPANVIIMYSLMVVSLFIGFTGVFRRVELWSSGKAEPEHLGRYIERFHNLVRDVLFQRKTIREKTPGIAHTLIYVGFLSLLFATSMVLIDHDLGIRIYEGEFYLAVTILSDVLGFGVLLGTAVVAHRRYIQKADQLHNRFADSLMLSILALLIIQGFLLEGLRIHATNDPWAAYSPIGLLVSKFFWSLSLEATSALHFSVWWFHTLTVFFVAAIFPYTKFFHVISSSANLFFQDSGRAKGALPSPGNIEELIEAGEEFSLGLGTIKDYSWKQLLDLDACTSCGRCQAVCPAYASGKPLSPKWLILDTRNHALALHSKGELTESLMPKPLVELDSKLQTFFLQSSGVSTSDFSEGTSTAGSYRASNEKIHDSVLLIGKSAEQRISGEVISQDTFWSCTTCMACVEACPVGINHVNQIVENRRNMVLMEGEIPSEAQATLKALETRGNPYGAPEDRILWLDGLKVPILEPGDSVDYLYWVGCVSAYDKRKQSIARSLVQLMEHAGLSFGILGTAEGCTGDPARRLGEENLFQSLAKQNIETLKSVQFKTLVANCPHCFNTIKNEYPQFGNLDDGQEVEIIHHSVLLKRLIAQGKINTNESDQSYTFHDPCYLGRYNDEYDAPRETLKSVSGLRILEMEKSKEKGMCCGAGGGHFWMDLKIGERVNVLRTDQAAETGANKIATGCPFCMQMMEDGVKLTERDDSMQVKDIAEVIFENLKR
ncbi:MAG: 4Fe-4S dicluster domain-containing protein [Deltaproteobacteria bacterium]|nr:4Fe-4S dicluster domain-containing protein [Deltaproteobacteria bacterium]